MLVAVAVSLVVNDAPQGVVTFGALGALALLAFAPNGERVDSRPMRRLALILAALVLAFPVAGCGGGEDDDTAPENVETTDTGDDRTTDTEDDRTTTEEGEEEAGEGDPANGKTIFASAGLRQLPHAVRCGHERQRRAEPRRLPARRTTWWSSRVTNGAGVMPSFEDQLSEQEIKDVAAYVSSAAGS